MSSQECYGCGDRGVGWAGGIARGGAVQTWKVITLRRVHVVRLRGDDPLQRIRQRRPRRRAVRAGGPALCRGWEAQFWSWPLSEWRCCGPVSAFWSRGRRDSPIRSRHIISVRRVLAALALIAKRPTLRRRICASAELTKIGTPQNRHRLAVQPPRRHGGHEKSHMSYQPRGHSGVR